jgi:hypothetical protein
MASRSFYKPQGSLNINVVKLFGNFTIGTSGAIDSSSCKGFSVAKTAAETGRYTVTLQNSYPYWLGCQVSVVGAADTAFGSNGYLAGLRNVSVNDSTPTFDVQITDAAGADTNPASGYVIYLEITLQNSTVNR